MLKRLLMLALVCAAVVFAAAPARADYASTVMALGPTAYYRLDEASGTTFVDYTGNNHTMTLTGSSVTYNVAGLLTGDTDTALKFTTNNATYLSSPALSASAWSIVLVMKLTGSPPGGTYTEAEVNGWCVAISPINASTFNIGVGAQSSNGASCTYGSSATAYSINTTYFVAAAFYNTCATNCTASHGNLSINGSTLSSPGSGASYAPHAIVSLIGGSALAGNNTYPGIVDEVAFFPFDVTQAQVNSLYNCSKGTCASGGADPSFMGSWSRYRLTELLERGY